MKTKIEKNQHLFDMRSAELISQSTKMFRGEFVRLKDGSLRRIAHVWEKNLPSCHLQLAENGSIYLGNSYTDFSGGLDSGLDLNLRHTGETLEGSCWLFDGDDARAHGGVYHKALFKVWDEFSEATKNVAIQTANGELTLFYTDAPDAIERTKEVLALAGIVANDIYLIEDNQLQFYCFNDRVWDSGKAFMPIPEPAPGNKIDKLTYSVYDAAQKIQFGYCYQVMKYVSNWTAFHTKKEFELWLSQRGLSIDGGVPPENAQRPESYGQIVGSFNEVMMFGELPSGKEIIHLCNGDYARAVVTDFNGTKVIYYHNPNEKTHRMVFDYREASRLLREGIELDLSIHADILKKVDRRW